MNSGPCMCGDPFCSSCGPAQGNYRCPYCGLWSAETDDDEPSGDGRAVNPETHCYCTPDELVQHAISEEAGIAQEIEVDRLGREYQAQQGALEASRADDGEEMTEADYVASDFAYDAARERGRF